MNFPVDFPSAAVYDLVVGIEGIAAGGVGGGGADAAGNGKFWIYRAACAFFAPVVPL